MEAGYNKPITSICMADESDFIHTLSLHFTILRCQAVLDQFNEGLHTLGVADVMKQYPSIMEPLFVMNIQKELSAGN